MSPPNRDKEPSVAYRGKLVETAYELLLRELPAALSRLITLRRVVDEAGIRPDSGYAVFRGSGKPTEALLSALSARVHADPVDLTPSAPAALETFRRAVADTGDPEGALQQLLHVLVELATGSRAAPAGWALHGVAMAASGLWEEQAWAPPRDGTGLARKILDDRRRMFEALTDQYVQLIRLAMSYTRRRPRPGWDERSIVVAAHALMDGLILRRTLDAREIFDSGRIAEAMVALALALSEPGALDDPRRPSEPPAAAIFDKLVSAARDHARAGRDVSVAAVARLLNAPESTAELLFPTDADLRDSVVRAEVFAGGVELFDTAYGGLSGLRLHLHRLQSNSEELPLLFNAIKTDCPVKGTGALEDFVRAISVYLSGVGITECTQTATALVQLATDSSKMAHDGLDALIWALQNAIEGRPGAG